MSLVTDLVPLFQSGTPVSEVRSDHAWITTMRACPHARVVSVFRLLDCIPRDHYLRFYFGRWPSSVMVPVSFGCVLLGWVFRALDEEKEFSTVLGDPPISVYQVFRARTYLDERFRFGQPFVISEGVRDAEALGRWTPLSFAALGTVSRVTAEFLSAFTDRVVYVPDNDEPGERVERSSVRALTGAGVSVTLVRLPASVKDAGDLLSLPEGSMEPGIVMSLLKEAGAVIDETV